MGHTGRSQECRATESVMVWCCEAGKKTSQIRRATQVIIAMAAYFCQSVQIGRIIGT